MWMLNRRDQILTTYQKILLSSLKVGNNFLRRISSPSDPPIKPHILQMRAFAGFLG